MLVTSPLSRADVLAELGLPAVGAALAAVTGIALISRRYAFRGRTLVAFLLAVGMFTATLSLLVLGILNQTLDTGAAGEHTSTIVQKTKQTGKSTTCHIIVGSWRPDHEYEDFTISQDAWDTVRPGTSTYTVRSQPGRFGIEWIVSRTLHQ